MDKTFKSGFVAIVGRPNVGKSTLINKLLGEKIAIMSNKPQTTRNQIKAIVNAEDYQIIFIDTPGIHKPKHKLGELMIENAQSSFNEVDAILFLVECDDSLGKGDQYIAEMLKDTDIPVILVINKIDTIKKDKLIQVIANFNSLMNFKEIIPISAYKGENIDTLINEITKILPEGPKYFSDDMITDQTERQIVSEIIREKILHLLREEVPHGVAVEIFSMKERANKKIYDIQANIYCDKTSHKGIIIGKNGEMLKKIGELSRFEIEKLLDTKVFLELWVKVKSDWRNNESLLKNLGYK